MRGPEADRFLGAWQVTESIYAATGVYCGRIDQLRHLYEEATPDRLRVSQICRPGPELAAHPLTDFAGSFDFTLQKNGRQRRYLGPDVEGSAWSWGEVFLRGEGVWPRFGYNFQSWSARISGERQLTGGIFYRGSAIAAVIVGVGTLTGSVQNQIVSAQSTLRADEPLSGSGDVFRLHFSPEREDQGHASRRRLSPLSWEEMDENRNQTIQVELSPRGEDFLMTRIGPEGNRHRGFAKTYGPVLYWDVYGEHGQSTQGIEVRDELSHQQFSIRRNYLYGQLISLEGWQLSQHE